MLKVEIVEINRFSNIMEMNTIKFGNLKYCFTMGKSFCINIYQILSKTETQVVSKLEGPKYGCSPNSHFRRLSPH